MKDWLKYLISTFIFFITFMLMELLFSKSIDFKMIVVATIMYGVLNTLCHMLFNRKK